MIFERLSNIMPNSLYFLQPTFLKNICLVKANKKSGLNFCLYSRLGYYGVSTVLKIIMMVYFLLCKALYDYYHHWTALDPIAVVESLCIQTTTGLRPCL